MKNERLTLDELMELFKQGNPGTWILPPTNIPYGVPTITYVRGKRLIYSKYFPGAILFSACEYCHTNSGLDENDCCLACGAPVE